MTREFPSATEDGQGLCPGRDTRAQGERLVFDERLTDFVL
jgi:hypothetical protein